LNAGTKIWPGNQRSHRIHTDEFATTAKWLYNYQAAAGSEEERTLSLLKKVLTGFDKNIEH